MVWLLRSRTLAFAASGPPRRLRRHGAHGTPARRPHGPAPGRPQRESFVCFCLLFFGFAFTFQLCRQSFSVAALSTRWVQALDDCKERAFFIMDDVTVLVYIYIYLVNFLCGRD